MNSGLASPEGAVSYCRLCEAGCGVRVRSTAGGSLEISPDREHIVTKGFFCTKGHALGEMVTDPRRVREPLRRAAGDEKGKFTKTGWDAAYDEIAARLREIIQKHGPDAVAFYHGNPIAFSWAAALSNSALARIVGSSRFYTAGTIDCAERFVLSDICYGNPLFVTIPDLARADFALLLGGNPAISTWAQLTSIPRWRERIAEMRASGGRFVVVDPRRTETADLADLYISILPGTDADLLLAMVNVILSENRENKSWTAARLAGLDEARAAIAEYTVERAASRCGIDANIIIQLARDFASAPRGFAAGHSGLTMQTRGSLAEWAVILFNAVCGRIDAPGGLLYNPGILNIADLSSNMLDRGAPIPPGTPPETRRILDDLPCAGLAPAIESGHVRALIIVAGNPLITFPNPSRLESALSKLDLIVTIDPYLSETGAHAHFVLPPPVMLEREDCVLLNSGFLSVPYAQWTPAICEPPAGVRPEWEIARQLARRLRSLKYNKKGLSVRRRLFLLKNRLFSQFMLGLGERGALSLMLRIFGKVSLRKMRASPHGMLLPPIEAGGLLRRLRTPGRRVRLFSSEIRELLVRDARDYNDPRTRDFPLLLISRRRRGGMNSWLNHLPSSQAVDPAPLAHVAPSDAARHAISDGARITIESATGSFVAIARIDSRMREGVVAATHSQPLTTGTRHFNHAVSDSRVDPLTGMPAFNQTAIRISLSL